MYACANVGAYIRLFKVRLLKSLTFATLLLQDFNTLKSLKLLIHLRLYFAVKRLALYFVRSACALCLCSHISASLGTRTLLHMTQPLVTLPHHSAPPRSASLGTACIAGGIASWHITASTASLRAYASLGSLKRKCLVSRYCRAAWHAVEEAVQGVICSMLVLCSTSHPPSISQPLSSLALSSLLSPLLGEKRTWHSAATLPTLRCS